MNNNNSNNNNFNDYLFFKIFRNIWLKKLIFEQLHILLKIYSRFERVTYQNYSELKLDKNKEYVQKLLYYGKDQLKAEDLPQSGALEELYIATYFIHPSTIPQGVKVIHYPNSIHSIETDISNKLPSSITTVINVNLKNNFQISPSIKKIIFSKKQDTQILPRTLSPIPSFSSLKDIKFNNVNWSNIKEPLSIGTIPQGVEILNLGSYDKPIIKDLIPSSVTDLVLNTSYKNIRIASIPSSVKLFWLESQEKLEFNNNIFAKGCAINTLTLESRSISFKQLNSIPKTVTDLNLLTGIGMEKLDKSNLPNSITNLKISSYNRFEIESLPNRLVNLECADFGLGISNLDLLFVFFPNTLKTLKTGNRFNIPLLLPNIIPYGLTELDFSNGIFNHKIAADILPTTLKILRLSNSFNQELDIGSIPFGVETLYLGERFNKELKLPDSITHLTLSHDFDQILKVGQIPKNCSTLIFGNINSKFSKVIDRVGIFPSSLTYLKFNCENYNFNFEKPNVLPSSLITFIRPSSIIITENALPPLLLL